MIFDPVRKLDLPSVPVIGVGGATLGGSGRTPLAIAVARALDAILVGHGYRGDVRIPRFVRPDDDPRAVGDEAVICARAVRTAVGPRREAIHFAAEHASTIVVDRLLQTRPRRLAYSLLAIDAEDPWGALPFRRRALLAACDEVVPIERSIKVPPIAPGARIGVVTSMARPVRVRTALERLGIVPKIFIERRDHAPLRDPSIFDRSDVDQWLVDRKTDVHLAGRRPALVIEHTVSLPEALLARLVLTSRAA